MSEKIVQLNEEVIKGQIKELVRGSVEETLTYMAFSFEHWMRRTNNAVERLNREIRRRTRVVGAFPDGNSVLVLVCAGKLSALIRDIFWQFISSSERTPHFQFLAEIWSNPPCTEASDHCGTSAANQSYSPRRPA